MNTSTHTHSAQGDSGEARISQSRREAIERARLGWIRKLIDVSRRNNLLYYRPLKTGTLDLSSADPHLIADLVSGCDSVPATKLLPTNAQESFQGVLRTIGRRAQMNAEEKGLGTLFLAIGMATWPATDGGRPADAPVLLVPISLGIKGARPFSLARNGSVQINLVLLHILETQFGISITSEELAPHLLGGDEGEVFDPKAVYSQLQKLCAIPGFEIRHCFVLGNFAFQKMAMVKDLQEHTTELMAHDMVAALAGNQEARDSIGASQCNFDPRECDRIPPDEEFIVLDADSSQQTAIATVAVGHNTIIHGPPGTGKSQTIANLVSTLAAGGHRVLFVAEKRAALEVVLRRLRDANLAHLAIDLHGADLSAKRVMEQVAEALAQVCKATAVDAERIHSRFVDRRAKLNNHVQRLHAKRDPSGLTL